MLFRSTQSLAVTIRVLVDENLTTAKKLQLLWKEMRVGLCCNLKLISFHHIFDYFSFL